MMQTPELRDAEPPDDAVVVIRGGLHSLDVEKVIQVCEDSSVDFGFYGLSVFAAFDGDVEALSSVWIASVALESSGWPAAVHCAPRRLRVGRDRRGTPFRRRASCARQGYCRRGEGLLRSAGNPAAVKVGSMLVASNSQAIAVVRVVAIDDDGQIHFSILPASIDMNRHLLDSDLRG